MKIIFLSLFSLMAFAAVAQPKLITNATISTTTNIIAPEEEDVSQIQNRGGGGFNMSTFGDGETKTTTYIKNDMVKTAYKSEIGRGSVYRNEATKVTTTIIETMGNKSGFYTSDDDLADRGKRRDSMMKERAKTDTAAMRNTRRPQSFPVTVAYTEESKKIAGYNCKKAWLITDKLIAKDSLAVWYTPDIKFAKVASTGGLSGLMSIMGGAIPDNFDKIDGFVMQYERNIQRGRKMEVKVTRIDLEKEVADKEFDLPKDVEIKSMKEMSADGGGGFRMMMRQ